MRTPPQVYDSEAQRRAYEATWEAARTVEGLESHLPIEWLEEVEEKILPHTENRLHNGRPYIR